MKYILEFGNKGGAYCDNIQVPSAKLAAQMACALVNSFENDPRSSNAEEWRFPRKYGRTTWESETHFVAISKLDGRIRGAASAGLWRRGEIRFLKTVIEEI